MGVSQKLFGFTEVLRNGVWVKAEQSSKANSKTMDKMLIVSVLAAPQCTAASVSPQD